MVVEADTGKYEQKNMTGSDDTQYKDALRMIPAPGTGCHPYLLRVANYGVWAGKDPRSIFMAIRKHIPPGDREVPDGEIWSAIEKAVYDHNSGHPWKSVSPRPRSANQLDATRIRECLIRDGQGASDHDLYALSGTAFDTNPTYYQAVEVLQALWGTKELIFLGDTYDTNIDYVGYHIEKIVGERFAPPHLILNPLDGEQHLNKSGRLSYRCDAAVKDHRFVLVEFDNSSKEDQLAYWFTVVRKQLLPVAALVDSGGKSIHAWLRVDLPDAMHWNQVVREYMYSGIDGCFTLQGADRSCVNPSRLSRLPGHYRKETSKWQRLLYLN